MNLRLAWLIALAASATVVTGCCSHSCCGVSDAPLDPLPLSGGVYAGAVVSSSGSPFPQDGGSGFMMTVDRDHVRVRYERNGQVVEEFWRVTTRDTVPCLGCRP